MNPLSLLAGGELTSHRRRLVGCGLVSIACALCACSSKDPLDQIISQLDDLPRREQAIDALLQFVQQSSPERKATVKERVLTALTEAYREDENRGEIIEALAILHDPRAKEVFLAALRDTERGDAYAEAAVRAARSLGELGLKSEVPSLIEALKKSRASSSHEQNIWLERALVKALDTLGDARAADVLIQVLLTDPLQQDFYLNRMAAEALGRLGHPAAIKPLILSLTTSSHGLLLYEESRRALCRIGPKAVDELLHAAGQHDKREQPEKNAAAAMRVLADLADPALASRLLPLLKDKDPPEYRLALAETLLRLARTEGEQILTDLLSDSANPLTARRQAAELLGWYGTKATALGPLEKACAEKTAAQSVLCWSMALAQSRLGGKSELAKLDAIIAGQEEGATRRYLQNYRPRLVMATACAEELECYEKQLAESDWRLRERAVLSLNRLEIPEARLSELALSLAQLFPTAHVQVKQALLIVLERLAFLSLEKEKITALLQSVADQHETTPPTLISRAFCLGQRLSRAEEKR